jgi:hypothetical protein
MPLAVEGVTWPQTEVIVDNAADVDTGTSIRIGRSASKLTLRSRIERLAIPLATPLTTAEGSILVIAGLDGNTMLLERRLIQELDLVEVDPEGTLSHLLLIDQEQEILPDLLFAELVR